MLQRCYQTKKSNNKLMERQVKRLVQTQVKDNIQELENNKREKGSTSIGLS